MKNRVKNGVRISIFLSPEAARALRHAVIEADVRGPSELLERLVLKHCAPAPAPKGRARHSGTF